ncbi:MAG: divalent-cation tolerance protein CutA [Nitrospinae bacterium]|nr:divalent-cation tolerance protein CutA [Nitrospinota bacterium]
MKAGDNIVVLITAGGEDEAERIAKTLVEENLAACVNIISGLRSIYRWEGKTCDEGEVLLVVKSSGALFDALEERARALHSYSTPEIVALPITHGSAKYMDWLNGSLRK